MKTPQPNRHFNLVLWRLDYHVPLQVEFLDEAHIRDACQHAKYDLAEFEEQMRRFPREWTKMMARRQRRREFLAAEGHLPPGWTPPDPRNRRTRSPTFGAYLARRHRRYDTIVAGLRSVSKPEPCWPSPAEDIFQHYASHCRPTVIKGEVSGRSTNHE